MWLGQGEENVWMPGPWAEQVCEYGPIHSEHGAIVWAEVCILAHRGITPSKSFFFHFLAPHMCLSLVIIAVNLLVSLIHFSPLQVKNKPHD